MATDALRRNLSKAIEAAGYRGRGAWDSQVGAGFGTPEAARRIRQYPVSEQERIVSQYQERDVQRRRKSTKQAIGNIAVDGEGALDELLPVALNTPSHSSNPSRPRALRGGYDSRSGTVRVQFRDGSMYEYYDVPRNVWKNALRSPSFGRSVNRVLDTYPYSRVSSSPGAGGVFPATGMFSTDAPEMAGLFENPGGRPAQDQESGWTGYVAPRAGSGWFRR